MRMYIKMFPILVTLVVMLFIINNSAAQQTLFDMEGKMPVISLMVDGSGAGQLKSSQNNKIFHSGKSSLCWEYDLPQNPQGNYPTIEFAIPTKDQNWNGKSKIGIWMYLDSTNPKTFWTIQPVLILSPSNTRIELGNWNVGEKGIPPNTWVYHEWTLPKKSELSKVTHLRLYYHAGDGWKEVAKSNKITIYFDDISLITEPSISVKGQPMEQPNVRLNLSFSRDTQTGKAIFLLNKKPFYPVMYYLHYNQITPEIIDSIQKKGCNAVILAIDAADVGSGLLEQSLDLCASKNIPTIVEINEWEFWSYLRRNLDKNMMMLNGKYVQYFPDYANI